MNQVQNDPQPQPQPQPIADRASEEFESLKWEIQYPMSKNGKRTKIWCKETLSEIVVAYDEDLITKDEYQTLLKLFKSYPEGKEYVKF